MKIWILSSVLLLICSCQINQTKNLDVTKELAYCDTQIKKTLVEIEHSTQMPRNIADIAAQWKMVDVTIDEWTVGFFPGILWYDYEYTQDEKIRKCHIFPAKITLFL